MVNLYHYLLIPFLALSSGPLPKLMKKINNSTHSIKKVLHLKKDQKLADSSDALGKMTGKISYYGKKHDGRKTASGERYDMNELTASHKTFPFGTRIKITNPGNNKSVVLTVNDRLPRTSKREVDVSYRAAQELGMIKKGIIKAEIAVVQWGSSPMLSKAEGPVLENPALENSGVAEAEK